MSEGMYCKSDLKLTPRMVWVEIQPVFLAASVIVHRKSKRVSLRHAMMVVVGIELQILLHWRLLYVVLCLVFNPEQKESDINIYPMT